MKQTAVEWLYKTLIDKNRGMSIEETINKAKEMEKQQQGYSDEEVLDILGTFLYNLQMGEDVEDVKEWFEQFKKK